MRSCCLSPLGALGVNHVVSPLRYSTLNCSKQKARRSPWGHRCLRGFSQQPCKRLSIPVLQMGKLRFGDMTKTPRAGRQQ